MVSPRPFLTGIIEGFYGRPWSHSLRLAYADYLARLGLNTCLYAPKSDATLRRQWREEWPREQWTAMEALARAYRERDIFWGVGLSPMELYRHYGPAERSALKLKLHYLTQLDMPVLAILFDDMPGDCPDLALRQAEIVSDVVAWQPQWRVVVCPTYYSFDPLLETHFGAMPSDYWRDLGQHLPGEVDIFWTGNEVCSRTVTQRDITRIDEALGRPVLLWDNYPVNDGAKRSNFLYLQALEGREQGLETTLAGHLCNPMNQGLLSLPALNGLARLYGGGIDEAELGRLLEPATWCQLQEDAADFAAEGLSGMGADRCAKLAEVYAALPGQGAREAWEWLRGEYAFDPACLTD